MRNSESIEDYLNNNYGKYSRYTGYEEFSKTEKREYDRIRDNLGELVDDDNYQRDNYACNRNYTKNAEKYDSNNLQPSTLTPSRKKNDFDNYDYRSKLDNCKNTESFEDNFTKNNQKFTDDRNSKNSFEIPILITPKNYDNKNSDRYSSNTFSTIKNTNCNNVEYSTDSLNNTNMIGYNPLKINEVSNNNEKMTNIKNKINDDLTMNPQNNKLEFKSSNRRFDETSINKDFKMLDNLKNKIKDLESKIGEINNGKKYF